MTIQHWIELGYKMWKKIECSLSYNLFTAILHIKTLSLIKIHFDIPYTIPFDIPS